MTLEQVGWWACLLAWLEMESHLDLHAAGHIISVGAILGSAAGYFPAIAAIVAFVWYSIQIWESTTVQHYVANRRTIARAKKIAKLKKKEKVLLAKLEAMQVQKEARVQARAIVEQATAEAEKEAVKATTDQQTRLPPV